MFSSHDQGFDLMDFLFHEVLLAQAELDIPELPVELSMVCFLLFNHII